MNPRTVLLVSIAACFMGCGPAEVGETDGAAASAVTAASSIGSCSGYLGYPGKLYSFGGGNYRVCYIANRVVGNVYSLKNNTSAGHTVKLRIANFTDPGCRFVGKGKTITIFPGGVGLIYEAYPQNVTLC